MAQSAIDALTADPLDADTIELLGFLYAKEGADPVQLIQQGKFEKTLEVLNSVITNMRTEVIGYTTPSHMDVIIFCHYGRFVEIDKSQNLWRDGTTGLPLRFKEQPCRGGTFIENIALAVTMNPEDAHPAFKNNVQLESRRPTQIQLCPWFVDWVKSKKFKLVGDVQKRTKIGRFVIKLAEWKGFGLAQIDAYSLLDKVLLHEMTHGRGAYELRKNNNKKLEQQGLLDVPSANSFFKSIEWAAYGWKGAMKIAKTGDDLGGNHAPDNNADTIALLGSVCKLMNHESEPRKVDSKGRIVPRAAATATR
ncbi:hypothetical protein BDW02DRAFT_596728 [Decorospora gaudefroyi]|uniref:Uncharacterized protein n=1 Tax=Decorospora gaudefroyi TaxID=184978 RepID=A0A6A5KKB4_9PLEO|nr:hypothetical protein BDW02DRAFT_596728 [Decorospora gaudefroyi]